MVNNERLDRGLAADKRTAVLAAGIGHALDQGLDGILLGISADDAVQDR